MLQHNATIPGREGRSARGAHAAHAAVVGMHILCCGIPAALMLATAGAGASIGLNVAAAWFEGTHAALHVNELWILGLSFLFVALGGALEWRAHRWRRLSALFAVSVVCFAINGGLIWAHHEAPAHPPAAIAAAQ